MLATAGGLVFSGGTSDRKMHAFDADNGQAALGVPHQLRHSGAADDVHCSTAKQYIAVHAGWGGDSRGMQANLNRMFPGEYPEVPEGGAVWVFALE